MNNLLVSCVLWIDATASSNLPKGIIDHFVHDLRIAISLQRNVYQLLCTALRAGL